MSVCAYLCVYVRLRESCQGSDVQNCHSGSIHRGNPRRKPWHLPFKTTSPPPPSPHVTSLPLLPPPSPIYSLISLSRPNLQSCLKPLSHEHSGGSPGSQTGSFNTSVCLHMQPIAAVLIFTNAEDCDGRWSKSTIILWFCGATLVLVHLHQKLSDVQFLPSFRTHRDTVKQ